MEVAGRMLLAASLLQAQIEALFKEHGLSTGAFDVLATLRRQGPPYEIMPTALYQELLITSGTMTHRLDGLERRGLIERVAHPTDRRGLLVRLTAQGVKLTDTLIDLHMNNEKQLFAKLTKKDQSSLAGILNRWIESVE